MPILNWLTRDEDIRTAQHVPYRLLEEVPHLSAGGGGAGNMLIQGDNLEALKSLLPFYAGRVKCIYIDPPYNTRSAFEHYDDNLEHTQWLAMMWPRLELLRDLLAEDGSIWVSIDDNEGHYLKVIMDEVFGRSNFIGNIIWQKRTSPANDAIYFSKDHDNTLVFARDKSTWRPNRLPLNDEQSKNYKNPDNDPRGPWNSAAYTCAKSVEERPNLYYPIIQPVTGKEIWPKKTRVWAYGQEAHKKHLMDDMIWWGRDGKSESPRIKKFLSDARPVVPRSIWANSEVGHNQEARNEALQLFTEAPFTTPKPERLVRRILLAATNPGDIVLDSFLGSGTTAAVAHKMGRRYIGIEMGAHAVSHCAPRLQMVVDGEQGGISKAVDWQGGGGFRFYRLGPPVFDEEGHIRQDIRFPVLAAHVWFSETDRPWNGSGDSPLLGIKEGRAYALLYNGILGDKRPKGGNVLTRSTLALIREEITKLAPDFNGPVTVYGEQSRLTPATLERERITFKQTPYDVKARA
jgi:adenine-specific DNA-methyltransferase